MMEEERLEDLIGLLFPKYFNHRNNGLHPEAAFRGAIASSRIEVEDDEILAVYQLFRDKELQRLREEEGLLTVIFSLDPPCDTIYRDRMKLVKAQIDTLRASYEGS